ncbi:MAG: hypothetical protein ACTSQP_00540 [Promethearchaeota archaeon]
MGLLHDQIAEKIALYFIEKKTFGNRYLASKLPIFPKPDIVLLGLSKEPKPQIAFEVKPPHAVKREYLTGLGQVISYAMNFPLVYIVLPDETIDNLHIPTFIKEIIEKSDLKIGVIKYNLSSFKPEIIREAVIQEQIDIEKLEKKIIGSKPRAWLFWMDTKIDEVADMLKKIAEVEQRNINGDLRKIVLDEIWNETLSKRYPNATRPASFKLNYQLFLDTLSLWTGTGRLTVLGNRLYEIAKKYGSESNEFKDALHYVILTEGGYLKMLLLINKIQNLNSFEIKGSKDELNSLIKKIRNELGINKIDYEIEKEKVLPIYKKRAPNCWFKIIGSKLFEMGYGRSLTQINEELKRRFSPYFQKKLKTNFYIGSFVKYKGYIINWERIIRLIEGGEKNLNIF